MRGARAGGERDDRRADPRPLGRAEHGLGDASAGAGDAVDAGDRGKRQRDLTFPGGDPVVVTVGDFIDYGDGFYGVLVTGIPNVQQGAVKIYDVGDPSTTLDLQPVNTTDDPCAAVHLDCVADGVGSLTITYCLKTPITGAAIEGATVEVYTDADRLDRVAVAVTDADGNATFMVDPGTYYLFRYKVGVDFTNPHVRTFA